MLPRRPYLLRAFYEWLLDNDLTPHLVVDVTLPNVEVPMEFARDGEIVLNIAPRAVGNLELGAEDVRFNARFGGISRQVNVPLAAVLAIYARENGAGTLFEPEAAYQLLDDQNDVTLTTVETLRPVTLAHDAEVTEEKPPHPDDHPPHPPRGGRPALRVVK